MGIFDFLKKNQIEEIRSLKRRLKSEQTIEELKK